MTDGVTAKTDYEGAASEGYTEHRRADPRIAARIESALGSAVTVLNVGAGAGSYEPAGREVVAVEPSAAMRALRPEGSAPVVDARAEELPFEENSFDAALACITVHHWDAKETALKEMRRVARGPVVVLTLDLPHHIAWQRDYLKPLLAAEATRFPTPLEIASMLGPKTKLQSIHTPLDCTDGFVDAYWGRPEALLDPEVRRAQSGWALLDDGVEQQILDRLRTDLESGAWDAEHGHLRTKPDYDGALRIVVDDPAAALALPRRI